MSVFMKVIFSCLHFFKPSMLSVCVWVHVLRNMTDFPVYYRVYHTSVITSIFMLTVLLYYSGTWSFIHSNYAQIFFFSLDMFLWWHNNLTRGKRERHNQVLEWSCWYFGLTMWSFFIAFSEIQKDNAGNPRCTYCCFNSSDSPGFQRPLA